MPLAYFFSLLRKLSEIRPRPARGSSNSNAAGTPSGAGAYVFQQQQRAAAASAAAAAAAADKGKGKEKEKETEGTADEGPMGEDALERAFRSIPSLRPPPAPTTATNSTTFNPSTSPDAHLTLLRRWLCALPAGAGPGPSAVERGTAGGVLRLLFPEADVHRRYGLRERQLIPRLAEYFHLSAESERRLRAWDGKDTGARSGKWKKTSTTTTKKRGAGVKRKNMGPHAPGRGGKWARGNNGSRAGRVELNDGYSTSTSTSSSSSSSSSAEPYDLFTAIHTPSLHHSTSSSSATTLQRRAGSLGQELARLLVDIGYEAREALAPGERYQGPSLVEFDGWLDELAALCSWSDRDADADADAEDGVEDGVEGAASDGECYVRDPRTSSTAGFGVGVGAGAGGGSAAAAAASRLTASELRQKRQAILCKLLHNLDPFECGCVVQLILRDLRPMLYPLPTESSLTATPNTFHSTTTTTTTTSAAAGTSSRSNSGGALLDGQTALTLYNSRAVRALTPLEAMALWHAWFPHVHALRASLPLAAREVERLPRGRVWMARDAARERRVVEARRREREQERKGQGGGLKAEGKMEMGDGGRLTEVKDEKDEDDKVECWVYREEPQPPVDWDHSALKLNVGTRIEVSVLWPCSCDFLRARQQADISF